MPPELNFQSTLASEKLVRSVVPKVPPVRGRSSLLAEGVASLELHYRAISPLFVDFGSCSAVKVPLHSALHDMLVAGSALNTKGGCQNCPLPCRAFLARQNTVPCPSSFRYACGVFVS